MRISLCNRLHVDNYHSDAVPLVCWRTEARETQAYGYDPLDRLTDWTLNNVLQEEYEIEPNSKLIPELPS
jgi:YD repeat-containing protein